MCSRFNHKAALHALIHQLARAGLEVIDPAPNALPNTPERTDIRVTDPVQIIRPAEGGLQLIDTRWWLIPWFYKGIVKDWKLGTFNCKVETAATSATFKKSFSRRRCLIPATSFYEWTGDKGKKTQWEFTRPDTEWFAIAGLWDRAHTLDGIVESCTMVTTTPGRDMAPYHNRQIIILEPSEYSVWLDPSQPLDGILAAQADRHLAVQQVN